MPRPEAVTVLDDMVPTRGRSLTLARQRTRRCCYAGRMRAAGRSVVGTVLVLVSIALFGVGWRLTETDRFFLLHAARTTGTIVEHELSRREVPATRLPITSAPKPGSAEMRARFHLVVSFATPSGDRIRFRSRSSYGRPPYGVGETVPIRYDRERPERARVDRRIEFVAPVLIWLGAVALLAVVGVGIAVYGPKHAGGTSQRRA